jgi:glycerol-3-phosphate cytidylyltransferase
MGSVLSLDELLERLAPLRRQSSRIVTTNGCFDLLHVGHLRYLQAARAQGDCLIIALNSDASVQRLKGPTRPIVPQAERAEMLAGLACVDFVVLFDEETPVRLLEAIRPTIHVKGAQYNEANLPEAPTLAAIGAEMRWIPMVEGRSTTQIIDKIRQTLASEASGTAAASC